LPLGLDMVVSDWSRDGKWMAFVRNGRDIVVAPATAPGNSFDFLATPARETNARFAPDGKWIAYASNESGRTEIYVRPFSGGPPAPAGKIQISLNGGEYPVWSPSGEELYYMSPDSSIYTADTRALGGTKPIQPPTRMFQACPGTEAIGPPASGDPFDYAFDTHDGRKFLVVCRVEPAGRFTVLMNWNFRR
jgi:dipeptidyl aminopeptidase/acylaminoacyl peptidase